MSARRIIRPLARRKKENIPAKAKFIQADITGPELDKMFAQEKFEAVNHHAAQIDVRESVKGPSRDALINIVGGIRLLEACEKHGVKKFLFSSTGGAIYG